MLQNTSVQNCTHHSIVTKVSPTKCCCEHTHAYCRHQGCNTHVRCRLGHLRVAPKGQGLQGLQGFARPLAAASTQRCCKINQARAAPEGRNITRLRPTRCCCKHTYACCRMIKLRVSPKDQRLHAGLADHLLLRAHTCVLQNRSMQSCTECQGLRRRG